MQAKMIHHPLAVTDQRTHGIGWGWRVGCAMAAQIIAQDTAGGRQLRNHIVPDFQRRPQGMQQHHGGAANRTADVGIQAQVIKINQRHCSVPSTRSEQCFGDMPWRVIEFHRQAEVSDECLKPTNS